MAEIDPVIHPESRLRVIASLYGLGDGDSISFPKLRKLLNMSGGNLSTHLRRLEDAGYIGQTKTIEGRVPATYVKITEEGRLAFTRYRRALHELLQAPARTTRESHASTSEERT